MYNLNFHIFIYYPASKIINPQSMLFHLYPQFHLYPLPHPNPWIILRQMSNITLFICKHFSEYFKNIRTFLKHITIYQYNTKKLIIPKHHQILSLQNSLMSTQVFYFHIWKQIYFNQKSPFLTPLLTKIFSNSVYTIMKNDIGRKWNIHLPFYAGHVLFSSPQPSPLPIVLPIAHFTHLYCLSGS